MKTLLTALLLCFCASAYAEQVEITAIPEAYRGLYEVTAAASGDADDNDITDDKMTPVKMEARIGGLFVVVNGLRVEFSKVTLYDGHMVMAYIVDSDEVIVIGHLKSVTDNPLGLMCVNDVNGDWTACVIVKVE